MSKISYQNPKSEEVLRDINVSLTRLDPERDLSKVVASYYKATVYVLSDIAEQLEAHRTGNKLTVNIII